MSIANEADSGAAEKLEAEKKAIEDATAVASAWPIGGYNSLIPLMFITALSILLICVDVSISVYYCLIPYVLGVVYVMLMIYSWINNLKIAYLLSS